MIQNLKAFKVPKEFRGRSPVYVQLWWIVQSSIFKHSPQFAYGLRRSLLRIFGAQIGKGVIIRPSVTVTYPWKVSLGDYVWIGDDVVLYSLGPIEIQSNAVVSQKSYLCTGDHDYKDPNFRIRARKITIESEAWVASDVFVGPGVTIGHGSVIGARSTVLQNMPSNMICKGYPCKPIKRRLTE